MSPRTSAILASFAVAIGLAAPARGDDGDRGFVRSGSRDGFTSFDTGTRVYKPLGASGPTVALVGVVHIGDASYYDALVAELSRYDIVLFESVLPRGAFGTGGTDGLSRQRSTQDAMLFLRGLIGQYAIANGQLPETLAELRAFVAGRDTRLARPFDLALTDAWGGALAFRRTEARGFELVSLGSDGRPGGRGAALDLVLRQLPAEVAAQIDGSEARSERRRDLYGELADALDTDLQVRSIDYDRASWIPADLPMEELLDRLWLRGERSATLEMLGNQDGLQQGIVRFLLSIVSKSPGFKRVVIRALGSAGERSGSGSGLGDVDTRIILDERNEAVVEKLRELLASPTPPASVAIFYGAAHMPDFGKTLSEEFGLAEAESRWYRAMYIDEWSAERIEQRLAQAKLDRERLVKSESSESADAEGLPSRQTAPRDTATEAKIARLDARIALLEERALLAARARAAQSE